MNEGPLSPSSLTPPDSAEEDSNSPSPDSSFSPGADGGGAAPPFSPLTSSPPDTTQEEHLSSSTTTSTGGGSTPERDLLLLQQQNNSSPSSSQGSSSSADRRISGADDNWKADDNWEAASQGSPAGVSTPFGSYESFPAVHGRIQPWERDEGLGKYEEREEEEGEEGRELARHFWLQEEDGCLEGNNVSIGATDLQEEHRVHGHHGSLDRGAAGTREQVEGFIHIEEREYSSEEDEFFLNYECGASESPRSSSTSILSVSNFSVSTYRLDRVGLSDEEMEQQDGLGNSFTADLPHVVQPQEVNTDPGILSDEDVSVNSDPGVNSSDDDDEEDSQVMQLSPWKLLETDRELATPGPNSHHHIDTTDSGSDIGVDPGEDIPGGYTAQMELDTNIDAVENDQIPGESNDLAPPGDVNMDTDSGSEIGVGPGEDIPDGNKRPMELLDTRMDIDVENDHTLPSGSNGLDPGNVNADLCHPTQDDTNIDPVPNTGRYGGGATYFETDLDDEDGPILKEVPMDSLGSSGTSFFMTETPDSSWDRGSNRSSTSRVPVLKEEVEEEEEEGEDQAGEISPTLPPGAVQHPLPCKDYYSRDHGNSIGEKDACMPMELEHHVESGGVSGPSHLTGINLAIIDHNVNSSSIQDQPRVSSSPHLNMEDETNTLDDSFEETLPTLPKMEIMDIAGEDGDPDYYCLATGVVVVDNQSDSQEPLNSAMEVGGINMIDNPSQQIYGRADIVESTILRNMSFFEIETNFGCTSYDSDDDSADVVTAIYRDPESTYIDSNYQASPNYSGYPSQFRMYRDPTQMEDDYYTGAVIMNDGEIEQDHDDDGDGDVLSSSAEDTEWGLSPLTEEDEEEECFEEETSNDLMEDQDHEKTGEDDCDHQNTPMTTADLKGIEQIQEESLEGPEKDPEKSLETVITSESSELKDEKTESAIDTERSDELPKAKNVDRAGLLMTALRSEVQSSLKTPKENNPTESGQSGSMDTTIEHRTQASDMRLIDSAEKLTSLDLAGPTTGDSQWEYFDSCSSSAERYHPKDDTDSNNCDATTGTDVYIDYKPLFLTQYSTELPREASNAISARVRDVFNDSSDSSDNSDEDEDDFKKFRESMDLSCSRSFVELKSKNALSYASDSDSSLNYSFESESSEHDEHSPSHNKPKEPSPKLNPPKENQPTPTNTEQARERKLHRMETIESSPRLEPGDRQDSKESEEIIEEDSLNTADDSSEVSGKNRGENDGGDTDISDNESGDWSTFSSTSSSSSSSSSDSGHMEVLTARIMRCDSIPEESSSTEVSSPVDCTDKTPDFQAPASVIKSSEDDLVKARATTPRGGDIIKGVVRNHINDPLAEVLDDGDLEVNMQYTNVADTRKVDDDQMWVYGNSNNAMSGDINRADQNTEVVLQQSNPEEGDKRKRPVFDRHQDQDFDAVRSRDADRVGVNNSASQAQNNSFELNVTTEEDSIISLGDIVIDANVGTGSQGNDGVESNLYDGTAEHEPAGEQVHPSVTQQREELEFKDQNLLHTILPVDLVPVGTLFPDTTIEEQSVLRSHVVQDLSETVIPAFGVESQNDKPALPLGDTLDTENIPSTTDMVAAINDDESFEEISFPLVDDDEKWSLEEQKEKRILFDKLQIEEKDEAFWDEKWEADVQRELERLQAEQQNHDDFWSSIDNRDFRKGQEEGEHNGGQPPYYQDVLKDKIWVGEGEGDKDKEQWGKLDEGDANEEVPHKESSERPKEDPIKKGHRDLQVISLELDDSIASLRDMMKRTETKRKQINLVVDEDKSIHEANETHERNQRHPHQQIREPDESRLRSMNFGNIFDTVDNRRYISYGGKSQQSHKSEVHIQVNSNSNTSNRKVPSQGGDKKDISHIQLTSTYKVPHSQTHQTRPSSVNEGNHMHGKNADDNSIVNVKSSILEEQQSSSSKDNLNELEEIASQRCDELTALFLENFNRIPRVKQLPNQNSSVDEEIDIARLEDKTGGTPSLPSEGFPQELPLKLSKGHSSQPIQPALREANSSYLRENVSTALVSIKDSGGKDQSISQRYSRHKFGTTRQNAVAEDEEEIPEEGEMDDVFVSLPRRKTELNKLNRVSSLNGSPMVRQDTPRPASKTPIVYRRLPIFMDVEEEADPEVLKTDTVDNSQVASSVSVQDSAAGELQQNLSKTSDPVHEVIVPVTTSTYQQGNPSALKAVSREDRLADAMSLESEGIRRSRHLETLLRQQLHDPDPKVNSDNNNKVVFDERQTTGLEIDPKGYKSGETYQSDVHVSDNMYPQDLDERGRDNIRSDRFGKYSTSPSRAYDRSSSPSRAYKNSTDSSYERSVSPTRVHDRPISPSRIYERSSSPVRNYDRSVSPTRAYDRPSSPTRKSYDRPSSPTREYNNRSISPSRYTRDTHHDERSSGSKYYDKPENNYDRGYTEREFQPIRHSEESTDRLSRPSSQPLNSGRQSASSETEMSRYFSNQEANRRPNGGDSMNQQKNKVETGRRSVDRLSEIMRRSNDRLADFDKVLDEKNPPSQNKNGHARFEEHNNHNDGGVVNGGSPHNKDPHQREQQHHHDNSHPRSHFERDHNERPSSGRDSRSSRGNNDDYDHKNEHGSSNFPEKRSSNNESSSPPKPALRQPLVTSRTTPLGSSRSAAPKQPNSRGPNNKDDAYRVQDLEDTVSSLKRCLRERENEVDDLKSQVRSFQSELHQVKNTEASIDKGHYERKIDVLIADKENMATEVWQLRQELDRCRRTGRSPSPTRIGSQSDLTQQINGQGSLDFDPNNPRALQRKIVELEAQLQDQQEVNESASGKLAKLEKQVEELQEENHMLQKDLEDVARPDLREENALLKEQLESLRTDPPVEGDNDYFRWEVRQLREELHLLRDRNHQLTQDNIRLSEHVRDLDDKKQTRFKPLSVRDSESRVKMTLDSTTSRANAQPKWGENGLMDKIDSYRRESSDSHRDELRYSRSSTPSRNHTNLDLPSSQTSLIRSNRTSEDLRTQDILHRDPYSRVRSDTTGPTSLHNGYDYGDLNGRAPSEKSDSTSFLTTPLSDLQGADKLGKSLRDSSTVSSGLKDLKPLKQDMIDDVIDEVSPTAKSGSYSTHRTATRSPTRSLSKTYNDSLVKHDIDIHIANGETETSVDDIDDDEFFLGPGKQTYKVSSSITGQRLTESFTSSTSPYTTAATPAPAEERPSSVLSKGGKMVVSDPIRFNGTSSSSLYHTNTQTNGIGGMKSLQQELDDLSDTDDLDIKRTLMKNGLSTGDYPLTARLSERRDSVGSDSTDYILNQAEQHLKHSNTGTATTSSSLLPKSSPLLRSLSPNPPNGYTTSTGLSSHGLTNLNSGLGGLSTGLSTYVPPPRSVSATPGAGRQNQQQQHHLAGDPVTSSLPSSPHPSSSSLNTHILQARSPSPKPQHISPGYQSQRLDTNMNFPGSGRPFVPRSVGDIRLEDHVKFTRQGGKISKGVIKYIGQLPGKSDTYLGIELEQELGKHDGLYEGQRYFTCKPNRGVFVAFSRVVMAWTGI